MSHTQNCVDVGEHFMRAAGTFTDFFCAACDADGRGEPIDPAVLKETYDDLCGMLSDAMRLTSNNEPEMAEAVEALEFIRDELSDGFNLR